MYGRLPNGRTWLGKCTTTGIAGYTLIYNSKRVRIISHEAINDIEAFVNLVKNAKPQSIDIEKYEMKNAFPMNVEIYNECLKKSTQIYAQKS